MRGISSKNYNANKYTKLLIYIPSNKSTTFIKSKLYIVNNLLVKALIRVNILKSKGIIINLNRNLIIIHSYLNLKVPIKVSSKGTYTNIIINPYSNK